MCCGFLWKYVCHIYSFCIIIRFSEKCHRLVRCWNMKMMWPILKTSHVGPFIMIIKHLLYWRVSAQQAVFWVRFILPHPVLQLYRVDGYFIGIVNIDPHPHRHKREDSEFTACGARGLYFSASKIKPAPLSEAKYKSRPPCRRPTKFPGPLLKHRWLVISHKRPSQKSMNNNSNNNNMSDYFFCPILFI